MGELIKPISTLFMLMSLDGKISTGNSDDLDVDKDFPKIEGIKEGLNQYYEIEQTTDLYSLNSGKVQAKIGANDVKKDIKKLPVSFLIIDNKPHLNRIGVDNFIKKSKELFIITTNKNHSIFERKNEDNVEILFYKDKIDFIDLFKKLKQVFKIDRLTIQTGETLNSIFLRNNLIDKISLIIAPALIGGSKTPSLIGGESIISSSALKDIKVLKLVGVVKLNNSYLYLKYDVLKDTIIEN